MFGAMRKSIVCGALGILLTTSSSLWAQELITPEAKIAAREFHELGMAEWYQANFERADELLIKAATLFPSAEHLMDAAGVSFAQNKLDEAAEYVAMAREAAINESGDRSQAYADALLLEAEIQNKRGDYAAAIGVSTEARKLLLELIKNPTNDLQFAREQAIHSYAMNAEDLAQSYLATGDASGAETTLRDTENFVAAMDFGQPFATSHFLTLAQAIRAQGRFDEVERLLISLEPSVLMTSSIIAEIQNGMAVVEMLVDVKREQGDAAGANAYLVELREQLLGDERYVDSQGTDSFLAAYLARIEAMIAETAP